MKNIIEESCEANGQYPTKVQKYISEDTFHKLNIKVSTKQMNSHDNSDTVEQMKTMWYNAIAGRSRDGLEFDSVF